MPAAVPSERKGPCFGAAQVGAGHDAQRGCEGAAHPQTTGHVSAEGQVEGAFQKAFEKLVLD